MNVRLLIALLLVTFVSTWAAETYEIERWAVGAVGLGWAGFGAALAGPTEYLINPAGLADAEWSSINLCGSTEDNELHQSTISAFYIKPMRTESASLGKETTFGTLAVSLHQSILSDYSKNLNILTDVSGAQSLATISFGSRTSPFFAYGINMKVLGVDNGERADNGFGLDLGVQVSSGLFKCGLSFSNLIPPGINLNGDRSYSDCDIRLGAAFYPFNYLSVGFEIDYLTSLDVVNYGVCGVIGLPIKTFTSQEGNICLGISNSFYMEDSSMVIVNRNQGGIYFRINLVELDLVFSWWKIDDDNIGYGCQIGISPDF